MEDHWPALPSIRTSNNRSSSTASSKVSCEESLNLELSRADVYNPPDETLTLMNQVDDAETLKTASHAKDNETLNLSTGTHDDANSDLNPRSTQSSASSTPIGASNSGRLTNSRTGHANHMGNINIFSQCFMINQHQHHPNTASPKAPMNIISTSSKSSSPSSNLSHQNLMKEGTMKTRSGLMSHGHSSSGSHGLLRSMVMGSPTSAGHMSKMLAATGSPQLSSLSGGISKSGGGSHGSLSSNLFTPTIRTSKGHHMSGNLSAFTMIPPDVVGKKKPAGYESDEPTSPQVTCIGRVRRKKVNWDALVRENKKCAPSHGKKKDSKGMKKGKVSKNLVDLDGHEDEAPRKSIAPSVTMKKTSNVGDIMVDAKLSSSSMQRSSGGHEMFFGSKKGHDMDFDAQKLKNVDGVQGAPDHFNVVQVNSTNQTHQEHYTSVPSSNELVVEYDISEVPPHSLINVINIVGENFDASQSQSQPPPDCLLLMRNSLSRSRSRHQQGDDARVIDVGLSFAHENATQSWRWGQVLT